MNLLELQQLVEGFIERGSNPEEIRVCVPIKTIGAIGGTPVADIKSIQLGFDWDHGKLLLYTDKNLMLEDPDTLQKLRKEMDDMGWSKFENDRLKRENKKLLKRIEEIEQQLGTPNE